jgi:hypothetical protein
VTVPVNVTSGRYRIFIAGFRVNNQTYDDPLNRDGWLDEIYAAAAVARWEGTVFKEHQVVKSLVYGDANQSTRIQAGSASASGGLKAGDAVPYGWSPSGPPGFNPDPLRFPFKIWEGTLRDGVDIVSVRPTLWEADGDTGAYEYWKAWALSAPTFGTGLSSPGLVATKGPRSPLYQFVTAAQYADPEEARADLFGNFTVLDFRQFDNGMKKNAGRFFPGKDRLVGLDDYHQDTVSLVVAGDNVLDFSRIHWVDRQVAFTREKVEAALNAQGSGGLAPGVIAISLVDEDHSPAGPLHGDYTMYVLVQRAP